MLNNFLDYQYQPYHKIFTHNITLNSIYLGDVSSALDLQFISSSCIKVVVTAAIGMDQVSYNSQQIKHIIYPLLDSKNQNISKFFNQFYQLIQQQIKYTNILVHCAAGISRSATLVISYIMKKNNMDFKQAIKFVRQKRPIVLPNLGFQRQLKQYQKSIKRNTFTSEFNQRPVLKTSQKRKNVNLQDLLKPQILPDIKKLGRTTIIKSKMLERNINFKLEDSDKSSNLFPNRKFQIRSHQSVYQSKMLKSKPLFSNNSIKDGKVQSARPKILQRSNFNFNLYQEISPYNPYRNQNIPSQQFQNKKSSSLSHRAQKRTRQFNKMKRNQSNQKQHKKVSILLMNQIGEEISRKIKLEEKKAKTQKNIRKRAIHRIIHL